MKQLTSETKDTDAVIQVYTTWVSLYEQLLVLHEQFQSFLKLIILETWIKRVFKRELKNCITQNVNVQQ